MTDNIVADDSTFSAKIMTALRDFRNTNIRIPEGNKETSHFVPNHCQFSVRKFDFMQKKLQDFY